MNSKSTGKIKKLVLGEARRPESGESGWDQIDRAWRRGGPGTSSEPIDPSTPPKTSGPTIAGGGGRDYRIRGGGGQRGVIPPAKKSRAGVRGERDIEVGDTVRHVTQHKISGSVERIDMERSNKQIEIGDEVQHNKNTDIYGVVTGIQEMESTEGLPPTDPGRTPEGEKPMQQYAILATKENLHPSATLVADLVVIIPTVYITGFPQGYDKNELETIESGETVAPGDSRVEDDSNRKGTSNIKVGDKVSHKEDTSIYGKVIKIDSVNNTVFLDNNDRPFRTDSLTVDSPFVDQGWQHKRIGTSNVKVGDKVRLRKGIETKAPISREDGTDPEVVKISVGPPALNEQEQQPVGDDEATEDYAYLDGQMRDPIPVSSLIVTEPAGEDTEIGYGGVGSPKQGGVMNTMIRGINFIRSMKEWMKGPYDIPMADTAYIDEEGNKRVFGKVTRAYGAGSANYFEFIHKDNQNGKQLVLYGHGHKKTSPMAFIKLKVKHVMEKGGDQPHPGHGGELPQELQDIEKKVKSMDVGAPTDKIHNQVAQELDDKAQEWISKQKKGSNVHQESIQHIKTLVEGDELALIKNRAIETRKKHELANPGQKKHELAAIEKPIAGPAPRSPDEYEKQVTDQPDERDTWNPLSSPAIKKLIAAIDNIGNETFGVNPGDNYGYFVKNDPGDASSKWRLVKSVKNINFNPSLITRQFETAVPPLVAYIKKNPHLGLGVDDPESLLKNTMAQVEQDSGTKFTEEEKKEVLTVAQKIYGKDYGKGSSRAGQPMGIVNNLMKSARKHRDKIENIADDINSGELSPEERDEKLKEIQSRAEEMEKILKHKLNPAMKDAIDKAPHKDQLTDDEKTGYVRARYDMLKKQLHSSKKIIIDLSKGTKSEPEEPVDIKPADLVNESVKSIKRLVDGS